MFDLAELSTLRGALDIVTVQGSDVQRIAALQVKIETEIKKIQSGPPGIKPNNNEKSSK